MIEEGKTGFIVNASNIDELVDRIRFLLLRSDRAREMGEAGRRKVERDHLPERVGRMFSQTLRRLAAGGTAAERDSKEVTAA